MKTESSIEEILENLLIKLGVEFSKITVEKKEDKTKKAEPTDSNQDKKPGGEPPKAAEV